MGNLARILIAGLVTLSPGPDGDGAAAQFTPGPAQQPPSATEVADAPSHRDYRLVTLTGYRMVTLNDFSCGDFCYLEVTEAGQRAPRALQCMAKLCWDWAGSKEQELPAGLRMTRAEARFATYRRIYDDSKLEAVIDLRLVKRAN
jgi:hypothetical protein